MTLSEQIRARRRKAALFSVLAVMVTFVLLLALRVVAVPWAIIAGFVVYYRMTRSRKYVLWLRRFHKSEHTRVRFNFLLNRACPGLCIPVTIQDSVFRTSYYSSGSQMILIAPLIAGLGVLIYLLCAVTIAAGLSALGADTGVSLGVGFLAALAALAYYGFAAKNQVVRRGHVALSPDNAVDMVDATLQKIAQRKLGFQGVMIFKCPDEAWRKVVSLAISRANAMIIDVSDLTENVLWEIKATLEKQRPESVLLAYAVPAGASEELPPAARGELERAAGAAALSRMRIFYYPAKQPPPGLTRGRLYTDLSRKLSAELIACMEHASA